MVCCYLSITVSNSKITLIITNRTDILNSRVILRKHFILDVFGGIAIACLEGLIISQILIKKETALSLFNWISDEKTAGSDAEVL